MAIHDTKDLRYACQIALPGFGSQGQDLLRQARVLVVGAGGLGCPAALYLASMGIGTLALADDDLIGEANLHRQILYDASQAGRKKVEVACLRLKEQNPEIDVIPLDLRLTSDNARRLIRSYDIVLDCTDNFPSRYLLNDACYLESKPLVYGAIYQYEGQLALWNRILEDGGRSPNLRDLYPEGDFSGIPDCSEGGVIATLAGMIGCLQANEAIKFLLGSGDLLAGKLWLLDARTLETRIIGLGTRSRTIINTLEVVPEIPSISPEDLYEGLARGLFELVDIRTAEERQAYGIGGRHIPLDELAEGFRPEFLNKATVLYCATGKRSAEAVRILSRRFPGSTFYSLQGGLDHWKRRIRDRD